MTEPTREQIVATATEFLGELQRQHDAELWRDAYCAVAVILDTETGEWSLRGPFPDQAAADAAGQRLVTEFNALDPDDPPLVLEAVLPLLPLTEDERGRRYPRHCFMILEGQRDEHGYIPSVVTEDEAGHTPCTGGDSRFSEPWRWGDDIETAKRVCAEANTKLGLTDDDVTAIIISSMALGRV